VIKMKLTVGTRGSKLSLAQTNDITRRLEQCFPELKVETKIIVTTGDKLWDKPFLQISTVGMFEKEIDAAIVNEEVDFAVHSMKDLPIEDSQELTIAAIPKRESPNDVLISSKRLKLADLPIYSLVATGSPRRKAQLLRVRPDLKVSSLRGNIDTRMKKFTEGLFAATIMAEAGIKRLEMSELITERLSLEDFTPSAGQGALAIVTKTGRTDVIEVLRTINDHSSMAQITAERAFAQRIGGGCKVPVGVVARSEDVDLTLYGSILSPDGKIEIHSSQKGHIDSPKELGIKVAMEIRNHGIDSLIEKWREMNE
jgi:hydroxymethylbilane synthase